MDLNVFNPMNLVLENTNIFDIDSFILKEDDYFIGAIGEATSIIKKYNNESKMLYKSILESGSDIDKVNKAFSKFFNRNVDLVNDFHKSIRTTLTKFADQLEKIIKDDSKKYPELKKAIDKYNDNYGLTYEGYTFTIHPNIPTTDAVLSLYQDIDSVNKVDNSAESYSERRARIYRNIITKYNSLSEKMKDDWSDKFRGKILDKKYPISSNNYAKELFSIFRNGQSDTSVINVTKGYLEDTFDRFKSYKDMIKEVYACLDETEKEFKTIKKEISEIANRNVDKDVSKAILLVNDGDLYTVISDEDILNKINLFMKLKTKQIEQMICIYYIAFGAKLEAISDSYAQDRDILYKAYYANSDKIEESDKKEDN